MGFTDRRRFRKLKLDSDRNAPSWTTNLPDLYIKTIGVFSGYQNVLGYHVGNEVVIAANGTGATAFVMQPSRSLLLLRPYRHKLFLVLYRLTYN